MLGEALMPRYLLPLFLFSGCAASTRVVFDDVINDTLDTLFGSGTATADEESAITVISVSRNWKRGSEGGTYYQEDCAESVNGTTTLDFSGCCPDGWEALAVRPDSSPMCALYGTSATVIEVGTSYTGADGVFAPTSCTTAETGTLTDYTGCCPNGWDVLAMGVGNGTDAAPLCVLY